MTRVEPSVEATHRHGTTAPCLPAPSFLVIIEREGCEARRGGTKCEASRHARGRGEPAPRPAGSHYLDRPVSGKSPNKRACQSKSETLAEGLPRLARMHTTLR